MEKIRRLREELSKNGNKLMVVNMLDEVAWLFNLRGSDIDYNPGMSVFIDAAFSSWWGIVLMFVWCMISFSVLRVRDCDA